MKTMSKLTLYFKDVFPDIATFKAKMATYSLATSTDAIHAICFKYLYQRFCNSNFAYMTEDACCRHFFNVYDDVIEQYKKRLELIGLSYQMGNDDLQMLSQTLNAIANNDDTALSNPLDALASYVSMQQGSKTLGNKFLAYIDAIDKIKDKMIISFVRQFQNLFFWLGIDNDRFQIGD